MTSKNITFFGATGGCAFGTLHRSLLAGHNCRVLVRSPEKLQTMLAKRNIDPSSPKIHLEMVRGDVKDVVAAKKALQFDGGEVEVIVCGIGLPQSALKIQFSLVQPFHMSDPLICCEGVRTILAALSDLRSSSTTKQHSPAPLFVNVATAGVATTYREFPILMYPFYRWLLNPMIADKRLCHDALVTAAAPTRSEKVGGAASAPLVRFVSVRPSHLNEGEALGMAKIRAGAGDCGVRGYSINKEDVGLWMFEEFVKEGIVNGRFLNEAVVVTY